MSVDIPDDALSEKFLAATGPGGQNVNKVATACQLRVDVYRLGLAPETFQRLKIIAGSKMTNGGELVHAMVWHADCTCYRQTGPVHPGKG